MNQSYMMCSSLLSNIALVLLGLLLFSCEPSSGAAKKDIASKGEYARGEMEIQHGMEIFNRHCASCHNFTENLIGPNLTGITAEVDKQWLKDFIKNPIAAIESGDERAVALFEKYKQYMPPFPMFDDKELEDVLSFIHKFSQGEKRNKNNRKGGLLNPIPEIMETADFTLVVEEQFKIPASSDVTPSTRINQMSVTPNGRLFIIDLRGKIHEIKNGEDISTYMDVSEILINFVDNPGKGSGLGSLEFHPDFEKNGLFYTTHVEPPATATADYQLPDSIPKVIQSVLLEWKADDPNLDVFAGTHRELLRVDMTSGAHAFQQVAFNPLAKRGSTKYGMMYFGIGDGANALRGYSFLCDNINHIWGSIIRIDPLGTNGPNGQYGIPKDNPFVDVAGALGEIWAYGFRNPHRMTWDDSGKMLISNIGQHSIEEVNLGKAGANYGWPYREGTFLYDTEANVELVYPIDTVDLTYTDPVIQYDHDEGSAVSGGFVYDGDAIPKLRGKYIFGDMSRGTIYYSNIEDIIDGQQAPSYKVAVEMNGEVSDMTTITGNYRVDLRIGRDHDGELYFFTKEGGTVYKVIGMNELVM